MNARRVLGIVLLGPLIWWLLRWLVDRLPPGWRERLESILPPRLFDTRPGDPVRPETAPEPYEAPGPDDPESTEPLLSPDGSPGAHRVIPS